MKTTTEILNAGLEEAKRRVERARMDVHKLKANRRVLGRIVNMVTKGLGDRDSISVDASGDIYISMRDLSGFKSAELEIVLNTLENLGECKSTKDWAQFYNRDFHYVVNGVDVFLAAYVKTDSETCKRIVVGTEMVETLKYQIVCD